MIASAPKPKSTAKWWTSLGSPDSISRPTFARFPVSTKYWCTFDTIKAEGIAVLFSPIFLSDNIIYPHPSAAAALALVATASITSSILPSSGYVISIFFVESPVFETPFSVAKSRLFKIGDSKKSRAQLF